MYLRVLLASSWFFLIASLFGCTPASERILWPEEVARQDYDKAKDECSGGLFDFVGGDQLEQVKSYEDCMREKGWSPR